MKLSERLKLNGKPADNRSERLKAETAEFEKRRLEEEKNRLKERDELLAAIEKRKQENDKRWQVLVGDREYVKLWQSEHKKFLSQVTTLRDLCERLQWMESEAYDRLDVPKPYTVSKKLYEALTE